MKTAKEFLIALGLDAKPEEILFVRHRANMVLDHPLDVAQFRSYN